MKDSDGTQRRVHPIFVGDYPEQILVTCVKSGQCPKCEVAKEDLGDPNTSSNLLNILAVRVALNGSDNDSAFVDACTEAGIKPVSHPFWKTLPYVDIFQAITPNVLDQLFQGVFKHLVSWLKQPYEFREIDARTQRLIPNHHIQIFPNGVTSFSRVTSEEHNFISRIILGVIADMRLPTGMDSARLPVVSARHLMSMRKALDEFHRNKQIFIDSGICDIPQLHACVRYVASLKLFGTTDNYNTQQTERLKLDYTKEMYRASNTDDEDTDYEYPQMTSWLERLVDAPWQQQTHGTRRPYPSRLAHISVCLPAKPQRGQSVPARHNNGDIIIILNSRSRLSHIDCLSADDMLGFYRLYTFCSNCQE
ncbi:hypothetical protein F5887DRAFT_1070646 [Amanita rubescens]|nr:hypothetical protein F5887DRAFT_1070646 [Amanita rubescens]